MTGSNWVNHWTSGTVYECIEIAGSTQYIIYFLLILIKFSSDLRKTVLGGGSDIIIA
jgi:hypothetical protein